MQVTKSAPVTVMLVDPTEAHLAAVLDAGGLTVLDDVAPDDAARTATEQHPDVVLIDLDGDTGRRCAPATVDAIEALAVCLPELPVLALSAGSGAATVLAAVRAGAAGYLVRTVSATDLVDAVRRTAAGHAVFSPGLASAVLEEHIRSTGSSSAGPARLTDREVDVLRLVVAGYTARQIAGRLVLSPRTVENHVQHMLRKIGVPNRAALVRHAIENGLA